MSALIEEAGSLARTILLAYHLHDTKKADAVRACADRLLERASKENKPYLLDITNKNNKEIHITINYLIKQHI